MHLSASLVTWQTETAKATEIKFVNGIKKIIIYESF